ncbi:MAG: recombination regulator RecX [Verrucomicrobiota bacterium]
MMLENNSSNAMAFALKLLGLRSHSSEELERKLLKKGYTAECIEPVLEKLKKQGVLDDRMFGIEVIKSRSRRKPSGKLKMRAELRKKGVSEPIIEELLNEYASSELCYRAAEKKIGSLHGTSNTEKKKKLEVFLHNRGFEWQEIQVALRLFFRSGPDDESSCQERSA